MSFFVQPQYGEGPGDHPLRIGAVTFNSDECPADLALGAGEQILTVSNLVGGGRVTHAHGAQPKAVKWSGHFWYETAAQRVKSLRRYMVSAQEIIIAYRDEQYTCVVKDFTPTYRQSFIEYEIEVEITGDDNGAFSVAAASSPDSQIDNLLQDAGAQADTLSGLDGNATVVQPSISDLQQTVRTVGNVSNATGTSAQSLLVSAANALHAAQAYLNSLTPLAPAYYAAARLVDILTLIQENIVRGQTPQTLRVQGGDLFEIASTVFGNLALAHDIADANGLATAVLSSTVIQDIALPSLSRS